MNIGYKRCVDFDFKEAVDRVRDELKKEGFGVMSEIAVSEHMRKKLNVEFEDYIILGACIPSYAYRVLSEDKEMGLLLPCNVVVYSEEGEVFVSAILPNEIVVGFDNANLNKIALEIEEKLKKVVDGV